MHARLRVLVVGCGGIGGIIATRLSEAGTEVVAVSRNEAVRRAVTEHGFRSSGVDGVHCGQGRILETVPDEPFDFVFLTTQPTDVEQAASQVVETLAHGGYVVCFQNGLCERRVACLLYTSPSPRD